MIVIDVETIPEDPSLLSVYGRYLGDGWKKFGPSLEKEGKPSLARLEKLSELNSEICAAASLESLTARIVSIATITSSKSLRKPTGKGSLERVFFSTDEKELLKSFWDFVSKELKSFETITFNGIEFDLPFLYFRSMVHGIKIPVRDISLPKYRVWPHFDVMQVLTFYKWRAGRGLSYLAHRFGYECDPANDFSGADVLGWYLAGDYNQIQEYNLEDCRKTLFLYKRIKDYFPPSPRSIFKTEKNPY